MFPSSCESVIEVKVHGNNNFQNLKIGPWTLLNSHYIIEHPHIVILNHKSIVQHGLFMMIQYNEELLGLLSYFTAEKYKILHSVSRWN